MGTDDDMVFLDYRRIVSKLSQSFSLSSFDIAQLDLVSDRDLTTDSMNFMAHITASLDNDDYTINVDCVINREGKVLYWQEF